MYIGIIQIDYTGANANEYQKLSNALDQAGWQYAETSSFVLEADTLNEVQVALEVLARGIVAPGTLSSLAVSIQRVQPHLSVPARRNHPKALNKVLATPLPQPTQVRHPVGNA